MGSHGLTVEQTEFFGRNGYVVVEGLLSAEELARADNAVHEIVEEQRPLGDEAERLEWEPARVAGERVPRRIYNPVNQHRAFEDIALSDKVLDRVESLFGADLQFHHSKLNIKPARVGSVVEWHQDVAYFPHTNTDLLACLIYLDDADADNGCLQVIPGQHRKRLFGHSHEGHFAGKITEPGWDEKLPAPVACEAPAGSMIMVHCLTPHSSVPNRSERPRRTLIMEYRAADAYPIYFDAQINRVESFTRQVRGQRAPEARFTLTSFPMPQVDDEHTSLYDLQSRYRGD